MRTFTAFIGAVLLLAAPTPGLAKGGTDLHWTEQPKIVRAGPPLPNLSPSQFLGGCGSRRYRDPQTQRCRGPADLDR